VLNSATGSLTSAAHWTKAAPLLNNKPDDLELLLLSTQLGRHLDPQNAKNTSTAHGWTPLSDQECCEKALDIVTAYADSLLGQPSASTARTSPP
jgi:hypothetical protein